MATKISFLHVCDDGSELWFPEQPTDLSTLKVEIKGRVQRTKTYVVVITATGERKPVRPRGTGWELEALTEAGNEVIWVRGSRRGR
jgi:hypothetical protein